MQTKRPSPLRHAPLLVLLAGSTLLGGCYYNPYGYGYAPAYAEPYAAPVAAVAPVAPYPAYAPYPGYYAAPPVVAGGVFIGVGGGGRRFYR